MTIAFGPVPSRRLGRSLGVNNIPPKFCSYSCLYCQVGTTYGKTVAPQEFYQPEEIRDSVESHLLKIRATNEPVDYLTFVPDGEPGLDINLGKSIDLLRPLDIPIAIISNASLLWRQEVRSAFHKADWVSVKVDSVDQVIWKKINRPHQTLSLPDILNGIHKFAQEFSGKLVTETMLIEGMNDGTDSVTAIADFLHGIGIRKSYLAIPTRPAADKLAHGPDESAVNNAFQILNRRVPEVEYLIGYEGDAFSFSGDIRYDLLSITSVHPLRESAIRSLLEKAGEEWSVVEKLILEGNLTEIEYEGKRYYLRRFKNI